MDGENIKNLKLEWLRSQIGLVTQEPALLSLSIRDNIAYGRDATFDQIEEAAKIAHAHTFISSLEKGYETQVNLVRQDKCSHTHKHIFSLCLFAFVLFCFVLSFFNLLLRFSLLLLFISGGESWFTSDRRAKDKTFNC